MKTFFAFTTGLLTGIIGGLLVSAGVILESKEVREAAEKMSERLDQE